MKQFLLNLISNAVKFTPRGGHVVLDARAFQNGVELTVRDDGNGIPVQALERLGRPFEQACADPNLAKGGQGLGLALVRALAEKHGATVAIESEEGLGTTVRVQFPSGRPRAAA